MGRERWAEDFTARAKAHWTPERTALLLDGKDLPIKPFEAAPLLRAIGLLNGDGSMPPQHARKYRQINHMVILLESAVTDLWSRHARVRLLDAGCGRSYLSLLFAWLAKNRWSKSIEILGVDRNAALIEECRRRAVIADVEDVIRFEARPLADVEGGEWQGVLALHACDAATCDAIALGVKVGAELIAVAPCCQAELARGWAADGGGDFAAVWQIPHLRRETAAHVTDAMRTLLLRAHGYATTAMEFVPIEHTKKNTLIRAVKSAADPGAIEAYQGLVRATGGVGLALAERLSPPACPR
mgnify:CR=1 FL=1